MSQLIKTDQEVETMKISAKICAQALKEVLKSAKVGISCRSLDIIAKKAIQRKGASPSFVTVDNYRWTICTTINDQVVHGIPTERKLKNGDILGIDIGALYKGFHSDMAITVPIGHVSKETQRFLKIGKKALKEAVNEAKVGNRIGDISATIQKIVEGAGYSIVRNLTGHGIGRRLHEDPLIPGFGTKNTGPNIRRNMALAIEVIYTQGSHNVKLEDDGWTITTSDGSLAGLFEQTVAIAKTGPIVLTPYL